MINKTDHDGLILFGYISNTKGRAKMNPCCSPKFELKVSEPGWLWTARCRVASLPMCSVVFARTVQASFALFTDGKGVE
jgi:hypothetical protein